MRIGRYSKRAQLLAGDGPLARVPPLVAFLVVIALFAGAILIKGALGAALLGLLAIGLGMLLAATWHVLSLPARVIRLVVFAGLVAIAISMLLVK